MQLQPFLLYLCPFPSNRVEAHYAVSLFVVIGRNVVHLITTSRVETALTSIAKM